MVTVHPLRRYAPDLVVALCVLLIGSLELVVRSWGGPTLLEVVSGGRAPGGWDPGRFDVFGLGDLLRGLGLGGTAAAILITVGAAVACALARHHGASALLVVWLTGGLQLLMHGEIMGAQLSVVYVTFALARWGSHAVIVASAVSIPIGALFATSHALDRLGIGPDSGSWPSSWSTLIQNYVVAAPVVVLVLGVPWLAGLAVRATRKAQVSHQARLEAEQEAARSDEIAVLRAQQARLAHDVHDVVGHSLAVILAQAESAQFLDPGDEDKIRETFANIAATSRRSLSDVRSVLTPTEERDDGRPGATTELNDLVDGVRAAGNAVSMAVHGEPRPLPPEIHVVAYRTLQEMLTNALKHGRRGDPVQVEQHWGDELYLRVDNSVEATAPVPGEGPGLGQLGMARRLESIGGTLTFGHDTVDGEGRYVAQAWLPVRAARTP